MAQKQVLGDDHAYPMIAYGTAKASAAWKLYAKSQGVPFELANEVSEQMQMKMKKKTLMYINTSTNNIGMYSIRAMIFEA